MSENTTEERMRCNVKAGAQILGGVIATTIGALYANVQYFHGSLRGDLPLILALNVGAIAAMYFDLRRKDIVLRERELDGPSRLIGRTTIPYGEIRGMREPSFWRSGYVEDAHGHRVVLYGHHLSRKQTKAIVERIDVLKTGSKVTGGS